MILHTWRDCYLWGTSALPHSPTPSLDVACLLQCLGNFSASGLFTAFNSPIPAFLQTKFLHLLQRRQKHEPIAYLTHNKEFYGLQFYVDQRVLIPRPASELLVELACKYLPPDETVLDVGTGSGCLAIACALHRPDCRFIGVDSSKDALAVAHLNAQRHHCHNVTFQQQDIFATTAEQRGRVGFIIANPPYISTAQMRALPPSVHNYEPHCALHADNLRFYHRLAKLAMCYNSKYAIVEIESTAMTRICAIFQQHGYQTAEVCEDLMQLPRVCVFRRG